MNAEPPSLPQSSMALLVLVFGAATSGSIVAFGGGGQGAPELLALGASLGALAVAGVWLFLIATRVSRGWTLALAATFWIPYVNLVVASIFARRYWDRGTRAPAVLGLVAILAESFAAARVLLPDLTPPV